MIDNIKKQSCAIVIPCFNEGAVIFNSLKSLSQFLDTQSAYRWSIIAVSDGSSDNTVAEIQRFIAQYQGSTRIVCHELKENSGKGNAIQQGLQQIDADYYGFIDADVSLDYKKIISNLPALFQKADIIIAKRKTRVRGGYSRLRAFGSRLFSTIVRRMFSLPYTDTQCGFKLFTAKAKNIFLKIEQTRFSFDVEFLVRARMQGFRIKEHLVSWQHNDASSVGGRDMLRYLLDLFSITEIAYSKKQFTKLYAWAAVIISFLFFGWTLKYGFFFSDDFTWLWHGSRIWRGELSAWTARMSTFYSPVLNIFYALLSGTVGFLTWVYFLLGLFVHASTAFLTGILVRILTRSSIAGFIAVVLFALVGGAYEPLVWIGANMHSIAAFFIVLSVVALLFAYQKTSKSVFWYVLSFVAFVFALATKEVSIVLPAILFFVSVPYLYKKSKDAALLRLYWLFTTVLSFAYLWQQYLWQKQSVWVEQGIWELSIAKLARLPVSLLDVFVPLKSVITNENALLYTGWALVLFGYSIYRFRKNSAVIIGLSWAVVAALPVIFFQTLSWWELLPSRYTYTVRVGMIIFVSAMIAELLRSAKGVRLAYNFFWVLLFASFLHTASMVQTVTNEYGYVYQTGRALHDVCLEIDHVQPTRVVVKWYRPFTQNYAHMVGAFDVIANIKEDNIIFLAQDEAYTLLPGEVFIEWNDKTETYLLVQK
jgi:glycosyltransferase involved in cell wall biosynthesis